MDEKIKKSIVNAVNGSFGTNSIQSALHFYFQIFMLYAYTHKHMLASSLNGLKEM